MQMWVQIQSGAKALKCRDRRGLRQKDSERSRSALLPGKNPAHAGVDDESEEALVTHHRGAKTVRHGQGPLPVRRDG
jgi:hypothetical protein